MMTRIVKTLFFLILLLVGAAFIAPSFIDWNQHKEKIIEYISPYLQRKIDIAGNISFQVIPQPEIKLGQVTLSNIAGAQSASLLTLKQLEARIKLAPLLEGRIEVETINLVEPVLNLEILEDGKAGWTGILKDKTADETSPPIFGMGAASVRLNQVIVTNGTLNYLNQQTGSKKGIENLNLTVSAETLLGPYHVAGDMKYQSLPVKIDVVTEAYDKAMSIPIHVTLTPAEGLAQVKLNGVMDLQSGIDVQGELSMAQGKLDGLFKMDALSKLGFMRENVDMRGVLAFKGDQFALNDIKAKFGKDGTLKGKISLQFSRKEKPSALIDLEGSNLVITDKPAETYTGLPGDFDGSLHFKGKDVIWGGSKISEVDINTEFNQQEWTVKSAHISLPGHSRITLAGTVTPKTNSAAYSTFKITTEDLGKLVDSFAPADNSIFKSLGGEGIVRNMTLSSGLDISPAKISFFNIDATLENKTKISGVLNVDLAAAKPNFTAKLHFIDWDSAAFPAEAFDKFWQKLLQSDADMELTAKNYTKNGFKIQDMSFKAKTDDTGLAIQELKGSLPDSESFILKGHKAADKYTADMTAGKINLDRWLTDVWPVEQDMSVTFHGDELVFQGLYLAHPVLTIETGTSSLKASGVEGVLWGGELKADLSFTRQDNKSPWSSGMKGTLKQADLGMLVSQLKLDGFSAGVGDVDFDLTSPDNTAKNAVGSVTVKASALTVERFNFDKLEDAVRQIKEKPKNFQQLVDDTFRKNGSAIFKDVQGVFKVSGGKIDIETLELKNSYGNMPLTGSADIAGGSYNVAGELHLTQAKDFPGLKITRTSEKPDYAVDTKEFEKFVVKNLPAPAPPAPAAPPKDKNAVKDILKRLDEEEKPALKPVAPPADTKPDIQKMLLKMQMEEMAPKEAVPLP